jgi:hypothetical protein
MALCREDLKACLFEIFIKYKEMPRERHDILMLIWERKAPEENLGAIFRRLKLLCHDPSIDELWIRLQSLVYEPTEYTQQNVTSAPSTRPMHQQDYSQPRDSASPRHVGSLYEHERLLMDLNGPVQFYAQQPSGQSYSP